MDTAIVLVCPQCGKLVQAGPFMHTFRCIQHGVLQLHDVRFVAMGAKEIANKMKEPA